jgi:hypothetical protein
MNNPENSQTGKELRLENLQPYLPFSATNQPSPESKKAGWARKQFREKLLDDILSGSINGVDNYKSLVKVLSPPLGKKELTQAENNALDKAWNIVTQLSPKQPNDVKEGLVQPIIVLDKNASEF